MIITAQYLLLLVINLALIAITLIMDATGWTLKSPAAKMFRHLLVLIILVVIIWQAYLNFPVTLTLAVIVTGVIALVDLIFFYRKRKAINKPHPLLVEYSRSFFGVLLIVWVIRSYIIQPYRVPTGSLEPTILPGDFIVVNQFAYGLRFPIGNLKFAKVGEPKTGNIVLFYYPKDPNIVFVKRVIGVPGDHIVYKNKTLYINGQEMKQTYVGKATDMEPAQSNSPEEMIPVDLKIEDLQGLKHGIYLLPEGEFNSAEINNYNDITVPPGMYFMMGDNRDLSDDSRTWGFVPEQNIIGKAEFIWLSWDPIFHRLRLDRIGKIGKEIQ